MTIYVGGTAQALLFAVLATLHSPVICTWTNTAASLRRPPVDRGKVFWRPEVHLLAGQKLTLKLGFSHDTIYTIPETMRAFLPDPTTVGLYGVDKEEVTTSHTASAD